MVDFTKWEVFDEDFTKFGGKKELSYTLSGENGTVQFNPNSGKLYIWSGMGLGSYHCGEEEPEEDNVCYGFEVKINGGCHLETLLQCLGFTDF